MKNLLLFILTIVVINCYGQTAEDYNKLFTRVDSLKTVLIKQIEDLKKLNDAIYESSSKTAITKRVSDIESKIKIINGNFLTINTDLNSEYKMKYFTSYNNIIHTIDLIDKIESNYNAISNNLGAARAFNLLAQVNSPTSSTLGFKFSDVIIKAAKEELESKLPEGKDRTRFANVIQSIVDNPFVSSISKSVPVIGTVTGIISSISSFFVTKTTPTYKDGKQEKGLTALDISTDLAFNSEQIKAFVQKINPFLNFYETLNNESINFEYSLYRIATKYKDLQPRIDLIKEQLTNDLNIKLDANIKINIDTLYKYSKSDNPNFSFLKIINNSHIINAQTRIYSLLILCDDIYKFHNEYLEIIKENFKNNIALISEAKQLPGVRLQSVNDLMDQLTKLQTGAETGFTMDINKMLNIQKNIVIH